jgi:hypothetical protein
MPGFTSRDDLINEITVNGKQAPLNFYKISPQNTVVGIWQTLWKGVGVPGAGADPATTPGTVYISDASTPVAGSGWFPDVSADQRSLLSFGAVANGPGVLMLYDRLAGVSGISTVGTGSKTVNSGALDRYSGTAATLNEAWLEVTTATNTTAPIVNLNSYTTADGTTAQTGGSVTFPAVATAVGSLIQLPLNASKQGVRSVEAGLNVGTASASTGTCNLIIIRPLARIPLVASQWNEMALLDDTFQLPRIFDNACLGLAFLPQTAAAFVVQGLINTAYG